MRKHEVSSLRASRITVLVAIALGCIGCGSGGPTDIIPDVTSAIVIGRALDAAGEPVASLHVKARVYRESCGVGPVQGVGPVSVTNAMGEYGFQVISGSFAEWQCVQILTPVEGDSSWVPIATDNARFRLAGTRSDSTRIDITVPE